MTTNLLVPLDGSLFSEQAVTYALELARRADARLHLVMVSVPAYRPTRRFAMADAAVSASENEEEEEREYLARVAEAASWQTGIAPVTALLHGDVVPVLEQYALSHAIDLVVMTTHGRSGIARAWLGSVADALLHRLSMPLLLLRPQAGEAVLDTPTFALDHILITLNGSALSEAAIPAALALGRLTNARYTLVQVVSPPMMMALADALPVPLSQQTVDELVSSALAYLNRLASGLRSQGYTVDTAAGVHAAAASGIKALATQLRPDLITLATHGRSGITRFALGSVADVLVHGSNTPILLLRSAHKGELG